MPTNTVNFHDTITSIARTVLGIIVFTRTQCFGLSGSSQGGFRKFLISETQGCTSHRSVVGINGLLFFVSTDGLCMLKGAQVIVTSRPKLGNKQFDVVVAVSFDDVYYAQLSDGSLLVLDTRYSLTFYTLDFGTSWLFIKQDVLYMEVQGRAYTAFSGPLTPYSYQTGNLSEGTPTEAKIYSSVFIKVIGSLTVTVFIDGSEVLTSQLTAQVLPHQIGLPQDSQRGTSISFKVEGTGQLQGIFYKVERAQNA